jgi:hypothetical protein
MLDAAATAGVAAPAGVTSALAKAGAAKANAPTAAITATPFLTRLAV